MNRKDFIKSLIAGAAIAPTIILAKEGPVEEANNLILLSNVKDPISFTAIDVVITNNYEIFGYGFPGPEPILTGRIVSLRGVPMVFIGDIEGVCVMGKERNFIIPYKNGTMVFTGIITSYSFGDMCELDVEIICTNPKMNQIIS